MSPAGAFFTGFGVGAATLIALMTWSVWRLRNGPRPSSRRYGSSIFLVVVFPPVVVAFLMPDFKAALLAWLGVPIGLTVSRAVTTPVWYLTAQRIETRLVG